MRRKRAILAAGPVVKNSVFVQAETADMKPAWRMLTNSCRAAPPYKCRVLRSLFLLLARSLFLSLFYPASPFVITARRRKGFRVNEREALPFRITPPTKCAEARKFSRFLSSLLQVFQQRILLCWPMVKLRESFLFLVW